MVRAQLGDLREAVVAVVGLGYVGLPLAVELGKKRQVIGYDMDKLPGSREPRDGHDHTLEVAEDEAAASGLRLTGDAAEIKSASIYIVATPTPMDERAA